VASIFISYRRADTGGHAGRICDRLTARFGGDRVFLDIQDIHPGENFAASIEETIATCDCVIAVIGSHWLESVRERAQSGADFVSHEIAAALKRHVTIVPALVGGARMPAAADLPPELSELSYLNAVEIRDERFDQDVEQLETFLASVVHAPKTSSLPRRLAGSRTFALAVPALVLAAGIAGYLRLRPPHDPTAAAATTPAAPAIDGDWIAEMHKSGQPPFRIRLTFQRIGDGFGGMVRYPTGDGPMHDVTLTGRTLTFSTTHVPQFASAPVTIRFQADAADDGLHLLATDDTGISSGVASRAAPR
jgi:TIR domain-containing protein